MVTVPIPGGETNIDRHTMCSSCPPGGALAMEYSAVDITLNNLIHLLQV
jgi:hypothetical protein